MELVFGLMWVIFITGEVDIFAGPFFGESSSGFFQIEMVGFFHAFEEIDATEGSLIGLIDGVVFEWILLIAEDVLGFGGVGWFGLWKEWTGIGVELVVGLYFFHDFVGELFVEGGFGFGGGGEKGVDCFHVL